MAAIYFGANMMATPPMPKYKTEEKNRKLVLLISWGIALFFAWYGPDQIFNFFLQFLAWLIGPIATTVIIDYWLFPEKRKLYESEKGYPDMVINPAAYLAWIGGFLAGYFSQEFFISLINGMAVTGILYYVWMRIALNSLTTPEDQMRKLFGKKPLNDYGKKRTKKAEKEEENTLS